MEYAMAFGAAALIMIAVLTFLVSQRQTEEDEPLETMWPREGKGA